MASQKSRTKSTPGALRGLDANNILTPTPTQRPIEIDGHSDSVSQPVAHRYGTRTAKHGRTADTYDKYDMKHHPADWKLRPAQAAKRRSGSGSFSRSLSVSTLANDDEIGCETEEESLPESARDKASEQDSDKSAEDEIVVYDRKPDPGASRTSKRSEAKKFVNYSAKHHKDDRRIPGFRHKARQLKRAAVDNPYEAEVKKKQKITKARHSKSPPAPSYSEQSSDADDLVDQTLTALENVAPSIACHSTKLGAHIAVDSSDEENNSDDDHEEPGAAALEDDPLPAFTTVQDDADEDFSPSELRMSSHDIDEELLKFTQVPTSDGAGATNTAAKGAIVPEAHAPPTGVVEFREGSPNEVESEASTKAQKPITEVEGNKEPFMSPSTHNGVLHAVERKPSGTPDDADMPYLTADSHKTVEASAERMPKSVHFEHSPNEAFEDHIDSAKEGLEGESQGHSKEILAGAEERLAGIDKTQESSETLEGDVSPEGTASKEARSVSVASEGPSIEKATDPDTTGHSDEAVESEATTLQAMLEQDIAASEHAVANTSSSDIII